MYVSPVVSFSSPIAVRRTEILEVARKEDCAILDSRNFGDLVIQVALLASSGMAK
jgi:hypothetical protein